MSWFVLAIVAVTVAMPLNASGAPKDEIGSPIAPGDVENKAPSYGLARSSGIEQEEFPESPSFRNEVMAILSRNGCNLGTCHGNQNGKGSLKLSLRGQDPDTDFLTLTRQLAGRRVNSLQPEESLLLQKPLMLVPHEGGRRFDEHSRAFQVLRTWIAAGLPADSPHAASLTKLEVSPEHVTVQYPQRSVSISASATFSDGTKRDVTELAVFDSAAPWVRVNASGLAESEQAGQTTITVRYLNQQKAVRLEFVPDVPDFRFTAESGSNPIDRLVFEQLKRLRIHPSDVCDDTTFIRRVWLDVTGLLPPAEKAREFLLSADPDKRNKVIDELLASNEYVDCQSLRWADLLRVEEKTLDKKGVEVFQKWIRDSIAADKPVGQFVAEIIAARGSTYQVPPANFYRALRTTEERAESTAQLFLGIRLQCAKCHNHPFDRWTQDDYYGWSNFFARIDYEIIENKRRDTNDKHEFDGEQIVKIKGEGDIKNPASGLVPPLRYLGDGSALPVSEAHSDGQTPDRLMQLSAWISDPQNGRFAAAQANRVWYQLMGRGVVDPIDDFRATNPPANPDLLDYLQSELVRNNFSTKSLMRQILTSKVYQLSSEVNSTNETDETCFSRAVVRRLTAEQTLDAMAAVTGVPAKFGGHDPGIRAVQLIGVRNGGHRYSPPEIGDRFLQLFGKPDRLQTCECERSEETTLAQTFELVSGELMHSLLSSEASRIARAISNNQSDTSILQELYWSALSRPPSAAETAALEEYLRSKPDRRGALEDVVWALLNSNEFLLRR